MAVPKESQYRFPHVLCFEYHGEKNSEFRSAEAAKAETASRRIFDGARHVSDTCLPGCSQLGPISDTAGRVLSEESSGECKAGGPQRGTGMPLYPVDLVQDGEPEIEDRGSSRLIAHCRRRSASAVPTRDQSIV